MATLTMTRTIAAAPAAIYDVLSRPERLPEAVPEILRVEILGARTEGAGTRFRETRKMFGREASEEMEITEAVDGAKLVIASRPQGLDWVSTHEIEADGRGSVLRLTMEITPTSLAGRLMLPLMQGMIRRAVERDLDAVKAWCEATPPSST